MERRYCPGFQSEFANAALLEVPTAEVTRLLGLDGQTCVLAPFDQTLDVLRKIVKLEIAFAALARAIGHAAASHLAGGKCVGQLSILVQIGDIVVAQVERGHCPIAQRIAIYATLREMHATNAKAGIARRRYVKHFEIVQPLMQILLVLGKREELQSGAGALAHSTQRHAAQRIFRFIQRGGMRLRSTDCNAARMQRVVAPICIVVAAVLVHAISGLAGRVAVASLQLNTRLVL